MTNVATTIKEDHHRSYDPDPEALMLAITGVLIPIVSVLYQVAVEQHRSRLEDRRATHRHIQRIQNALALTRSTLAEIDRLLKVEGLKNANRWALSHRGVDFTSPSLEQYIRMVEDTAEALKTIEDAAVELSVFFKPSRRAAPWLDDLKRLQLLTSKIHTLDTYGEMARHLRWAVRIAQDVFNKIQSGLRI